MAVVAGTPQHGQNRRGHGRPRFQAEVWIDGKSAGETPIGNLALGIGPHNIVFRHPELGEKTVSTVVKAGVPTRVTVDLRK